ncbi:hypothetical protein [Halapricum salinum]|uniref:Preprotein translocase subunit TatA n=1 Tax=Halapricum salinum TaxID=1457250 RepID=A0A4D6HAL5_9EURY|nr:hypothetical protein [Halapricum salinum]QCC51124.1 hypothetical protein DV733_07670 [Halapricum salinum]
MTATDPPSVVGQLPGGVELLVVVLLVVLLLSVPVVVLLIALRLVDTEDRADARSEAVADSDDLDE